MQKNISGWSYAETKRLFDLAKQALMHNRPLSTVYRLIALETNRKEGSVRNHYYSHLNTMSMVPELGEKFGINAAAIQKRQFTTFSGGEAEELVATVLTEYAKGKSVRKTICELSGEDAKVALRLQNKYRSIVIRQVERTNRILNSLIANRCAFYHPYLKCNYDYNLHGVVSPSETASKRLTDLVGSMGVTQVVSILNAALELSSNTSNSGTAADNIRRLADFVKNFSASRGAVTSKN